MSLMSLFRIAVNGVRREGRQAYSDVFCAIRLGTAVANPLSRRGNDRLPGPHFDDAALVLYAHQAAQYDSYFLKLRPLTWLEPTAGRDHARHADAAVSRVHPAGEFQDLLRFVSRSLNYRRSFDESRHVALDFTESVFTEYQEP